MEAFTTHTGRAVPLRRSNVDTDQIIPAHWLKKVTRNGKDGLRIDGDLNCHSAIGSRYSGTDTFASIDGDGERGAEIGSVVGDLSRQM